MRQGYSSRLVCLCVYIIYYTEQLISSEDLSMAFAWLKSQLEHGSFSKTPSSLYN